MNANDVTTTVKRVSLLEATRNQAKLKEQATKETSVKVPSSLSVQSINGKKHLVFSCPLDGVFTMPFEQVPVSEKNYTTTKGTRTVYRGNVCFQASMPEGISWIVDGPEGSKVTLTALSKGMVDGIKNLNIGFAIGDVEMPTEDELVPQQA